jgi:diacylglycerol O-acyltransferase / trehalose O-mycolyltransferase
MRALAAALVAGVVVAGCGGGGAPGTSAGTAAKAEPSPTGIAVVAERRIDPRLTEWTLRTTALDEPTRVRVLVPTGYAAHPERRYPVLYLLHGRDGAFSDWTRYGGAERATARTPLIVVMPDGGRDAVYTDERADRWPAYHSGELVRWVDRRFRTVATRRGRAIAGLSMGGFGALSYAARNPGTYVAAASFSGALELSRPRPIDLAPRLRSLKLLELRTGDGAPGPLDAAGTRPGCGACVIERFLHPMNVRMHRRLATLGIRHVWDDYGPGTHDWPYWRRDLRETLPDLMRALASR